VFLEGVHGPLFAGSATARLGDRTRLLLGLGRFLDFFLASLALGALQVVYRLLVFEPLTFGRFSSGNSLGFGFCFGFFAGALPLKALSFALGPDSFHALTALGLVVDQDFGLDHGLWFEFFEEGFLGG